MSIGIEEKRSNEGIDKARMDISDVCVHEADDVSRQLIGALPKVFAFAPFESKAGQDVSRVEKVDPGGGANFRSSVGRPGVDDRELVDKRNVIHQGGFKDRDFLANRLFLVEGWDAERDLQSGSLLCQIEGLEVAEFPMMESVRLQPGHAKREELGLVLPRCSLELLRFDATETSMVGGRERLRIVSGSRPITKAVGVVAEMRPSLGDPEPGQTMEWFFGRVVLGLQILLHHGLAHGLIRSLGVGLWLGKFNKGLVVIRPIQVRAMFPDIAGHIVKTVGILGE